tara:strand:+ start:767 stop:1108 length:342 start_codon:yes stop_codon:yes gene_type:complete
MEIKIPEELFKSLTTIIKYQNTLLLKKISKEKGWKFSELKKEFLKDEDFELVLNKYIKKKKIKKVVTKEIKCTEYIFDGIKFFIDTNNNAYDENMEFVGVKISNNIDFNEDKR